MEEVALPTTRDAIADAVTADLEAQGKAETPPAQEAAAPEIATSDPAPPAVIVPGQETPSAKTLADTDLVIDPTDGQPRPWGEIKGERLRQADYTRKTMAIAEERRQIEVLKAQILAEQQLAQSKANQPQLPDLPEDDPYAQRIKAQQAQLDAVAQHQLTMQSQLQAQLAERELAASRMALEAEEQRLTATHGLSRRDLDAVEREYFHRSQAGEQVSLDSIAVEHKQYLATVQEAAVKAWKEKHRVGSAPAATAAPAPGVPESTPLPGRPGFFDAIREEFAAIGR